MWVKPAYGVQIGEVWRFGNATDTPQFQSLGAMMSYFLPKVLTIAGIIFFILVILAGFGMVMNAGSSNAEAMEKSKAYLTYALTGLIIIFASYWMLGIINYLTSGSLDVLLKP